MAMLWPLFVIIGIVVVFCSYEVWKLWRADSDERL